MKLDWKAKTLALRAYLPFATCAAVEVARTPSLTMSASADKRSMRLLMVCALGTLAGILMASADRKASKAANGPLTVEDRLKQLDHK